MGGGGWGTTFTVESSNDIILKFCTLINVRWDHIVSIYYKDWIRIGEFRILVALFIIRPT